MLALIFVSTGCKSILGPAGTPITIVDSNLVDKTSAVLKATVSGAVIIAVQKDANSVPYLRLASRIIDKSLAGGDTTPSTLEKSIGAVSVKELQGPEAKLAITAALGLYEVYWGEYVRSKIGGNYAATSLLTAVRDGINNALPPLPVNRRGDFIERLAMLRTGVNYGQLEH